jgi:hypothetical protein
MTGGIGGRILTGRPRLARCIAGHAVPRSPTRRGNAIRQEPHLTPFEVSERRSELAVGSNVIVTPPARPRDALEAVGLLLGILGVLLVVVVALGAAPPVGL